MVNLFQPECLVQLLQVISRYLKHWTFYQLPAFDLLGCVQGSLADIEAYAYSLRQYQEGAFTFPAWAR